jgi:hypothetical protein
MTGRIEALATPEKLGRITTNSGPSRFHFSYREPTGKADGLAMGRLVTFELEKGSPEIAVSVRPKEAEVAPPGEVRAPREIRYQGFEQTKNIRSYKFQAWRSGEENQEAIVTVDIVLFRRHGIGIQEGPGLCLRLVEAEFQEPGRSETTVWKRSLTDNEMLAHLACQTTSKSSRKKRT